MDMLQDYYARWVDFETNYDGRHWDSTIADWVDIPIYAICFYLLVVFQGPKFVKKPLSVRGFIALWNLGLSVFSIIGVTRVVPHLYNVVVEKGFHYAICTHPHEWYLQGPPGLWMILFIFSKFPELIDTVNLIMLKKPVSFLQWFHHATVLLYCWHSLHTMESVGIWFAAMNYCVHAVMYFYFFLAYFRSIFPYVRNSPAAQVITTMQVAQMVIGVYVTGTAYLVSREDPTCNADSANLRMGLVMYAVYAALFGELFYNRYIAAPKPQTSKPKIKKA